MRRKSSMLELMWHLHYQTWVMALAVKVVLLLMLTLQCNGLVCWHCDANSESECSRSGEFLQCAEGAAETVCATEVRRNIGHLQIQKHCKQREACLRHQNENWITSVKGRQCNDGDEVSLCRCCCYSSFCNKDETCLANLRRRCRRIPTRFVHGDPAEVTCSNGNSVGSTCRFKCDGDKVVTPSFSEEIICLPSGKWNKPIPNCAGACPPNLFVDWVVAVHRSTEEQAATLIRTAATHFLTTFDVGPNSVRFSRFHYDSRVHLPHIFFEDTINKTREELLDLVIAFSYHISSDDTGPVNTGAALQHIFDDVIGRPGDRPQAKNVVYLDTNENSDDNVSAPAKALRDAGVFIIPAFQKTDGGYIVNEQQRRDIAGYGNSEQPLLAPAGLKGRNIIENLCYESLHYLT